MDATKTHRDLVERCRTGDREAQFELYRLYSRAMYNTALRMVRHPHDAEDVLQSVFIEVFTKLDSFRYESTIGAWIKKITINKCINFLKSRRVTFAELTAGADRAEEIQETYEPEHNVEKSTGPFQPCRMDTGSCLVCTHWKGMTTKKSVKFWAFQKPPPNRSTAGQNQNCGKCWVSAHPIDIERF